jgi:hypothetical protein
MTTLGNWVSEKTSSETVLKASIGFNLKPQKPTKRVEEALFSLLKASNKKVSEAIRPFSDSFTARL